MPNRHGDIHGQNRRARRRRRRDGRDDCCGGGSDGDDGGAICAPALASRAVDEERMRILTGGRWGPKGGPRAADGVAKEGGPC